MPLIFRALNRYSVFWTACLGALGFAALKRPESSPPVGLATIRESRPEEKHGPDTHTDRVGQPFYSVTNVSSVTSSGFLEDDGYWAGNYLPNVVAPLAARSSRTAVQPIFGDEEY